nr:uncharacterized protein KIAA1614 homolog isoform X2 [Geotrypetes seraphini]
MDDPLLSERRQALRRGKACIESVCSAKLSPESTQHINLTDQCQDKLSPRQNKADRSVATTYPLRAGPKDRPSMEYNGQQLSCANTSVLQSKVKALKEKRVACNQGGPLPQDHGFPRKPKARRGKLLHGLHSEDIPSDDVVVNPQAQICTYLTDSLLNGAEDGADQWVTTIIGPSASHAKAPKGTDSEEGSTKIWISPQDFWALSCTKQDQSEMRKGKDLSSESWGVHYYEKTPPSSKTLAREDLQLPSSAEDLLKCNMEMGASKDLQFVPNEESLYGTELSSGLWRTDSWDSMGSIASFPPLDERVERNRALLKEMLNTSGQASYQEPAAELQEMGRDSLGPGLLLNDPDRDSGISLQDSEGGRAFVPQQELVPSTRHEQAKQLLPRTRMKARTSPLRASHHILSLAAGISLDLEGRNCAQDVKQNSLQRTREAHPSGNLSDSSSGESSCGRRNRGPSPSRVHFEDESMRDAEIRYLERLQQRQKRALDSVLLSLGQGPLVSKPDLSDYISRDLLHKQNGINKSCEQQSLGLISERGSQETVKGSPVRALSPAFSSEGKCSTCGSYIKSPASPNSDVCVNLMGNEVSGVVHEQYGPSGGKEGGDSNFAQQGPTTQSLGSRGSPLWILPSRQRIQTERIRETYIGKVTYIDDVDSALDSTDTSDSCRTDSEETGTSFSHSRVNRRDRNFQSNEQKLDASSASNLGKDPRVRKVQSDKSQLKSSAMEVSTPFPRDCAKTDNIVAEETNNFISDTIVRENYFMKPSAHSMVQTSKVKVDHAMDQSEKQTLPYPIYELQASVPLSKKNLPLKPYKNAILADKCRSLSQETDMDNGQLTSQDSQKNNQLSYIYISENEIRVQSPPIPESEGHKELCYISSTLSDEQKSLHCASVPISREKITSQQTSKPVSKVLKNLACTSALVSEIQNLQRAASFTSEKQKTPQCTSGSVPEGQKMLPNPSVLVSKKQKKHQYSSVSLPEGQSSTQYNMVSHSKGLRKRLNSSVSVSERQDTRQSSVPVSERQDNLKKNSTSVYCKSQLGAWSTNNCNNRSAEQHAVSQTVSRVDSGVKGHFSENSSINSEGTAASTMSIISSASITISLLPDGKEPSCFSGSPSQDVPGEDPQKKQTPADQSSLPHGSDDTNSGAQSMPLKKGTSSGLKKFFSALGHSTRQKLGRFRSSSEEHIPVKATGVDRSGMDAEVGSSNSNMKKVPSLQSLKS